MNDEFESLVEKILKTNREATKNYVKGLEKEDIIYIKIFIGSQFLFIVIL